MKVLIIFEDGFNAKESLGVEQTDICILIKLAIKPPQNLHSNILHLL
jgi:hypothetical protein